MAYTGTVKSFRSEKGFGFIECQQTHELYGKDMFVLKNALPGGEANKGDQVSFDVVQEHNGPVASNVTFLNRMPGPAAAPAKGLTDGGYRGQQMNGGGFYVGTVKTYNNEKGWGMINCLQTWNMYGKDVFFGRATIPDGDISVGDSVQFSIKMEEKGPAVACMSTMMDGGPTMGWEGSMDGGPVGSGRKNELFYGILTSWNGDEGWGNISCDESYKVYGRDVFVSKASLQGQVIRKDDLISFRVQVNHKGPQAATVSILPPGSFKTDRHPCWSFKGILKGFNAERGYGFLQGEDLSHIFGKDVFFHKHDLGGQDVSDGAEIQFTVELDAQGQPAAKTCSVIGGAYGALQGGSLTPERVTPY